MEVDIITLFPEMFVGPFDSSIVGRAMQKQLITVRIHNLRNWSTDTHKTVDDRPYSGGTGMVLKVDVIDRAIKDIKLKFKSKSCKTILLDATGVTFNQKKAVQLSKLKHLIIVCGHYEGVDYRVHEHLVDEIVSIGNYVLSGGEIAAMVLTDAITRLIPEQIDPESLKEESFNSDNTEYPQYTRPEVYNGWEVPKVLLSGNHKEIDKWKKQKSSKIK